MISAIISFPILLLNARANAEWRVVELSNGVSQIVWLIIGATLFFKSERIAAGLFPQSEQMSMSVTPEDLQKVGFSLIAIYFGIAAIASLGGLAYLAIRNEPVDETHLSYLWRMNPEHLASAAVQLVVCIALFFGSHGLSVLWQRVRGRRVAFPPE